MLTEFFFHLEHFEIADKKGILCFFPLFIKKKTDENYIAFIKSVTKASSVHVYSKHEIPKSTEFLPSQARKVLWCVSSAIHATDSLLALLSPSCNWS
jgi:hypothetical protein